MRALLFIARCVVELVGALATIAGVLFAWGWLFVGLAHLGVPPFFAAIGPPAFAITGLVWWALRRCA